VAYLQAAFQAERETVTDINDPPIKYLSQRLRKYDFTPQADEFVSRAKAYLGDKDYTYFDLSLELLKPLLKFSKGFPAILSPEFTIYGIDFQLDKYKRSIYVSLVLGNDLTIQLFNSWGSKQKDLPITRGTAGLAFYDEAICKKIANDPALEQIYDMLYWDDNGNVFLQSDDAKWVKRLLSKAGTAIVLDFIQIEQYNCRVPQVDYNKTFRGIVSKPLPIAKIIAANDSTPKSNIFHAKIGSFPDQIELNVPIEINILLLGEKKHVCRTLIRKNVRDIEIPDAITDSLMREQNYEEALLHLAPMLADPEITESLLFSIVQLAAHRPRTYLSSIFTQSVQMAAARNPHRLCRLFEDFSITVLDNREVKKIYCNICK